MKVNVLITTLAEIIVVYRINYEYFLGILILFYPDLNTVGLPGEVISSREWLISISQSSRFWLQ